MDEVEKLLRGLKALPIVGLLLIGGGVGAGKVTTQWLDLPEDRPVRTPTSEDVPQIYLQALGRTMDRLRGDGEQTFEYVAMYREHVEPVEKTLIKRGIPAATARQVAWPLVQHAYRREIDPATVVAIMLVESGGKPRATSPVGARGLMQVMPLWAGNWRACGNDLYDIESNLCHGINILDFYYKRNGGDERRALLGYNGCVRGTNTPNCHTYPDKVDRLRTQIQRDLRLARSGRPAPQPIGPAGQ
jgi:soluble lytic murein transglycosylase-like protein